MSKVRAKILGSRARVVASLKLKIGEDEVEIELREPNLAVKTEIARRAGALNENGEGTTQVPDIAKLAIETIVACAYEPGAIRPCFKHEDVADLLALGAEIDPLTQAAIKLYSPAVDQGNESRVTPS